MENIQIPLEETEQVYPPYLPIRTEKQLNEKPYTLVLDLDETLGHYVIKRNILNLCIIKQKIELRIKKFNQRPGLNQFLEEVYNFYEIVIFTAGLKFVYIFLFKKKNLQKNKKKYADSIIPSFDKKELISHKLYRKHCKAQNQYHIKDLTCIGRDLSKTIIIDNNQYNFQLQPENAIFIKSWYNDINDTELLELSKLLISQFIIIIIQKNKFFLIYQKQIDIVKKKPQDIRIALQKYRDNIIRQISIGINQIKKN
ncbi:NLI interacting factor-like phosphatase family protein, putative [Ichthyophthirius multifiliis]|uniref:Mitochondrial import inner membrane translocase subunit TIM50 n=1 Tax=Ichthyophthirius multifiliis TaxID=5932 RepID=G0R0T1_ICHMU|nr:NLI interacting factor-like phosphatase family protein, putative [Ichthyophthirius multifiliis]EGR28926.1 NLI interacting factor-like phosphatase family protein, putative [Ichthyophthirius multifiliis]|eukprot:XP_004030162.1 NLI interacting factor-like phosphatase family protein, putative [Ichthyophthirius multifiliis]